MFNIQMMILTQFWMIHFDDDGDDNFHNENDVVFPSSVCPANCRRQYTSMQWVIFDGRYILAAQTPPNFHMCMTM